MIMIISLWVTLMFISIGIRVYDKITDLAKELKVHKIEGRGKNERQTSKHQD